MVESSGRLLSMRETKKRRKLEEGEKEAEAGEMELLGTVLMIS